MSPSKKPDKHEIFQFLRSKCKKPKQQGAEKSPTEQTHAQDMKKAEARENEGKMWDNYIGEESRSW